MFEAFYGMTHTPFSRDIPTEKLYDAYSARKFFHFKIFLKEFSPSL
ncbi:hypothetical protein I6J17_11335 [Heyndrickxia coagulans]|nr:hypothetical protein [Heyndrickxia coagulans]AJH77274.1 hypothetical protein BF29_1813 [Heyndrickxia coagulans DSM 1 = ATCC 7050]MCR2847938.1 hypothetical protein [Heyndrickxia coagulans]QQS91557.1 hypothetical protein I6J17_11335 [Heyndrickxia coagulans]UYM80583.1 hypothetical protein OF848_08900 [Heyndrickxia coagulans]